MVLDSVKGMGAVWQGVQLFVFAFIPISSSGIAKEFLVHWLRVIGRTNCSKQTALEIWCICYGANMLTRIVTVQLYGSLHLGTVSECLCLKWPRSEQILDDIEGRGDHGRALPSCHPPPKPENFRGALGNYRCNLRELQNGALDPKWNPWNEP